MHHGLLVAIALGVGLIAILLLFVELPVVR